MPLYSSGFAKTEVVRNAFGEVLQEFISPSEEAEESDDEACRSEIKERLARYVRAKDLVTGWKDFARPDFKLEDATAKTIQQYLLEYHTQNNGRKFTKVFVSELQTLTASWLEMHHPEIATDSGVDPAKPS